jgi:hypothetical protein
MNPQRRCAARPPRSCDLAAGRPRAALQHARQRQLVSGFPKRRSHAVRNAIEQLHRQRPPFDHDIVTRVERVLCERWIA